jgi:hypothetical protein
MAREYIWSILFNVCLSSMNTYVEAVQMRHSQRISCLLASIHPHGNTPALRHRGEIVQGGMLRHEQRDSDVLIGHAWGHHEHGLGLRQRDDRLN